MAAHLLRLPGHLPGVSVGGKVNLNLCSMLELPDGDSGVSWACAGGKAELSGKIRNMSGGRVRWRKLYPFRRWRRILKWWNAFWMDTRIYSVENVMRTFFNTKPRHQDWWAWRGAPDISGKWDSCSLLENLLSPFEIALCGHSLFQVAKHP